MAYPLLLSVITPHLFALIGLEFAIKFPQSGAHQERSHSAGTQMSAGLASRGSRRGGEESVSCESFIMGALVTILAHLLGLLHSSCRCGHPSLPRFSPSSVFSLNLSPDPLWRLPLEHLAPGVGKVSAQPSDWRAPGTRPGMRRLRAVPASQTPPGEIWQVPRGRFAPRTSLGRVATLEIKRVCLILTAALQRGLFWLHFLEEQNEACPPQWPLRWQVVEQ